MRIFLWFQCPLAGIFRGMGEWPDTYCTSVKFTVGWCKFKPLTSINSLTLESPHDSSYSSLSQTQTSSFFHFPAFLCNYSSFIYLFCCCTQAPEALPWNEIKIQSMSHIWFAHPPTLKKTVKKKKQKTWHHLQLVFFISMLNVHVSPMSSCSGWLPSMSVHQKIKGSGGVKQITNSKSYTQFTVYQQYAC